MDGILASNPEFAAPIWAWLLGAAALGALTLWIYARCDRAEQERWRADDEPAGSLAAMLYEEEEDFEGDDDAVAKTHADEHVIAPQSQTLVSEADARASYEAWVASQSVRDVDGRVDAEDRRLAFQAALAEEQLQRALIAAKLGRLSDLTDIEQEAERRVAPKLEDFAATPESAEALGETEPERLARRNELLVSQLHRILTSVRAGKPVDAPRAEADLRRTLLGELDFELSPEPGFAADAEATNSAALREAEDTEAEDTEDVDTFANGSPNQQLDAALAEAASARAERSALEAKLWSAEWRLRQAQEALERPRETHAPFLSGVELAEEGQAETSPQMIEALSAAQADSIEGPVSPAPTRDYAAEAAEEERRLAIHSEADALRRRLSQAETALRAQRQEVIDGAALRQRLDAAEQELEVLRAADAPLAAPKRAAPNVALIAELETLRMRLQTAEAAAADSMSPTALAQAQSETEALRARLAERDSELAAHADELHRRESERSEHEAALQARDAELEALRAELAQIEAANAEKASPAERLAKDRAREAFAVERQAATWSSQAETARASESARELLREALDTPLSKVEDAARDLIQRGAIVAISSNRPDSLLDEPDQGPPDDLKLIIEISPKLEALMNGFGLYYFAQLAQFGPTELAWVDDRLALRGAVISERWSPQAQKLLEFKQADQLVLGVEGSWTAPSGGLREVSSLVVSPEVPVSPAPSELDVAIVVEAGDGTLEPTAPHPESMLVASPMSGAEAAAQDLLERPGFNADITAPPPGIAALQASIRAGDPDADADMDDFLIIRGVGPRRAQQMREIGLRRYEQLAALNPADLAWLDRVLDLGGRAIRDRWLAQARLLAQSQRDEARLSVSSDATEIAAQAVSQAPSHAPSSDADATLDAQLVRPSNVLDGPSNGAPDDLKLLAGVDADLERRLNRIGFYYFSQVARLTTAELAWVDAELGLDGRSSDANWRAAARGLAERKAKGALTIGGDGSWTGAARDNEAARRAEEAKSTPYSRVEVEAMRMINAGYAAEDDLRPTSLMFGPDNRTPDELQLIHGVSPKIEARLNDVGVFYFQQLSEFDAEAIAWVDAKLNFNGRIVRERWIAQAHELNRRPESV